MEEAVQSYEESVEDTVKPLNTGFKDIDEIYRNLNRGDLIVIGGLPGVGKTSFALDILLNITVNQGIPAVYMNLTEDVNTLVSKILRKYSPDEIDIKEELIKSPLYIDDNPGVEVNKLEERIIDQINKCDARVVFIDYLQLLVDYPRQITHEFKFNNISTTLKNIARTLGITLIVITKLSQAAYGKGRPILETVNLSGTIEYEADLIMILEQPRRGLYDYPDQDEPYRLNIVKNRHGKTTYIDFECDECRGVFKSVESLVALASAMNDFGCSDEFDSDDFKQEDLNSGESEQDEDSVFDDNDEF